MIGKRAPLEIFIDSLSLFDILTKETIPTETHLMISLTCNKHAYENEDTDDFFSLLEIQMSRCIIEKK